MFKLLSKFILTIAGWKVVGEYPYHLRKSIVIMAPHTSMWDFVLGRLGFSVLNVPVKFLIKKEMFTFPIAGLLKAMGGIPVDRGKRNNMVDYVSDLFDKYDDLVVVITPEGTRKYQDHWKKGFWFIAQKAKLPVVLGFLDYKKKEGGVGGLILTPTDDFNADFEIIQDFYRKKSARHPEKFNLSPKTTKE